jgi:hypothetical protein|tara:strand:+ start:1524 stop:2651 length:1128 start_codon:yes stop_codon:yes gene_type:complete
MAATTVNVQMQQRRDTAADWTSADTILLSGEIGYETDTGKLKIGDGSTAWSSLDYEPGFSLSAYPLATSDIADDAITGDKLANDITIANDLIVTNDLTVNGTTTTINSTTLQVDDKNIELGTVATPSDLTADGGGITLKGATDHTIIWTNSTDSWDFSEHVNLASGKEFQIDGTKVLDATSLGTAVVSSSLTSVGTITTGVWNGSVIDAAYIAGSDKLSEGNTEAEVVDTGSDGHFKVTTEGSERLRVDSAGVLLVGTTSSSATSEDIEDSKGGIRAIPQNSQTSAYTLVAADVGKHINITTGGVTVPSGVFSAGDAVTIYNNSGTSQTVTQGASVTMRDAGTGNTGNRTMDHYALATVLCVGSNEFVIAGAGLS